MEQSNPIELWLNAIRLDGQVGIHSIKNDFKKLIKNIKNDYSSGS